MSTKQQIQELNKSLIESETILKFDDYCKHIDKILDIKISPEEIENIHTLISNHNNDQLTNEQCRYLLSNETKIKYYNDYVCRFRVS